MKKILRQYYILLNKLKFYFYGVKSGKNILIFNKLYLKKGKYALFEIGNNFIFSSGDGYNPLSRNINGAIEIEENGKLIFGDDVGISSSCLWVFESIEIGSRTKIGADCIIMDSDAHSLNYIHRQNHLIDRPNALKKGIIIGEDVLIGTRTIILKGVTIGDRCIIGSGSVVTKSIEADCIAAGNPARVIRSVS
jgi:acetyltransferase-like isoleucine patch superfamily enzyme